MKNILLLLITLLGSNVVSAQGCSCESNFEWVKKTFEENDAGFEYVLEKKGEQAYKVHTEQIKAKIKIAENIVQCSDILYEWLEFFRSGHISVSLSKDVQQQNLEAVKMQDFSNWEVYKADVARFEKYLKGKKKKTLKEFGIQSLIKSELRRKKISMLDLL